MTEPPAPRRSAPPAPRRSARELFDRRDETPRTAERAYGEGIYRRRILVRLDGDRCWGELEDDFHHFRVELHHDENEVVDVIGAGVRSPWTACLDAGRPLQAMVGTPLTTGPLALSALDARQNCTHMFDLAGLVVTHAARGVDGDRLYDMAVDDQRGEARERHARLWRDGTAVLEWHLHERTVIGPAEWVDAPLWQGFIPWAGRELDDDLGEAAVALRRACDISAGRQQDLDDVANAAELLHVMSGICHAFQPAVAPVALRRKGSGRDFTDHEDLLLADFDQRQ
ncbi:MAG: hypothetical protein RIB98_08490 [Acidimicrobiales bacterium]